GELRADLDGYIALLAPEVRNLGVVVAEMGVVVLAAGEAISLTFDSDSHLTGVVVDPAEIKTLIDNRGAVYALGGYIVLSAQSAERLHGGVVNNSGAIAATGITMKNGKILLEASDSIGIAKGA